MHRKVIALLSISVFMVLNDSFAANNEFVLRNDKNDMDYSIDSSKEPRVKNTFRSTMAFYVQLNLGFFVETISVPTRPPDASFFNDMFAFNQTAFSLNLRVLHYLSFGLEYAKIGRRQISVPMIVDYHFALATMSIFSPVLFDWKIMSVELALNLGVGSVIAFSRGSPSASIESFTTASVACKVGAGIVFGIGKYASLQLMLDYYVFHNELTQVNGAMMTGISVSIYPFAK